MTEMMIHCPKTNTLIDTGRNMKPDLFRIAEVEGGVVDCPDCGERHEWRKADVLFTS